MVAIKNIVVEKGNAGTSGWGMDLNKFKGLVSVPVWLNFDRSEQIGTADIFKDDDALKANIIIDKDMPGTYYPSIGITSYGTEIYPREGLAIDYDVTELSLSQNNQDPTILPITIYQAD